MLFSFLCIQHLFADPCGMVPPVTVTSSNAIARTGAQRTYVFHKDGIETIALRPGFTGSVEDFGMLIPFPSPPALRKIEDDTFAHIEAAIQPPKVFVRKSRPSTRTKLMDSTSGAGEMARLTLQENDVRVLNQEAVGMYQVAVLEAGSAKALSRWMEDNGYRYPQGMDKVTEEYVAEGWCFVAIKAAVGSAAGVNPEPGKRSVDPTRSAGSSFDGHVQGMAFRFASKHPVVPMRLSVFNGADPRNVVYMLTDKPTKIKQLSESLVLKQVKGKKLYSTLTEPLEVEFSDGITMSSLSEGERQRLSEMRNYEPHVAIAKTLFASDLLAVEAGQLSLPVEENEKELLRISESFGLRGAEIDVLHGTQLKKERSTIVEKTLPGIAEMHLSVMDGIFDGSVLAAQNLLFEEHSIPFDKGRNDPLFNDSSHQRTLWIQ